MYEVLLMILIFVALIVIHYVYILLFVLFNKVMGLPNDLIESCYINNYQKKNKLIYCNCLKCRNKYLCKLYVGENKNV